jgi:hypothetical protein
VKRCARVQSRESHKAIAAATARQARFERIGNLARRTLTLGLYVDSEPIFL